MDVIEGESLHGATALGVGPEEALGSVASGAGVTLLGRVAGRVVHLATQVVVARGFGPYALGLYAIGWAVLRLGGTITLLGLDHGVVNFGSRFRQSPGSLLRGVLERSMLLASISGLAGGVAIWLTAPFLAEGVWNNPDLTTVIRLAAVGVAAYPLRGVLTSASRISQRMVFSVIGEDLSQPLLTLLLLVAVLATGGGLIAAMGVTVLSFWASLAIALWLMLTLFRESWRSPAEVGASTRAILAFSLPASVAGVFSTANLWMDRLMAAAFLPATDVGYYQSAAQISMAFSMILASFNAIVGPVVAEFHATGDRERIRDVYRASAKWATLLCSPIAILAGLGASETVTVVFGREYSVAAPALLVLILGQLVTVSAGSVGIVLVMTGEQTRWLAISGAAFTLNIVANLILIPRFGIVGAAFATSLALAAQFLAGAGYLWIKLGVPPYSRRSVKVLVAVGAGALLWWVTGSIAQPLVRLLVAGPLVVGGMAAAYLLQGYDGEDLYWIGFLKSILRSVGVVGRRDRVHRQ